MKNINSVLFVSWATLISGFIGYLYHPIMIRNLSIEEFWVFESLLSLLNIFLVLIIALGLFYTKEVSNKIHDLEYAKSYRELSIKMIRYVSLWFCSILFIMSPLLWKYLGIPFYYILPLWLTIIYSFYAVINNAFFQSLWKFSFMAFVISSASFLKLFIWLLWVFMGFHIFWALAWIILAQIWMYYIGNTFLNHIFKQVSWKKVLLWEVTASFLWQKKQILQYLFTSVLIALFMNIDILIVKNMFDGETAWYYAAISVLAKFLIFLWLSIETVYYPQLVKTMVFPKMQLLKISMYYVIMTGWAIIFFVLFGEIVLRLFKDGLQEYIYLVYPLLTYCWFLAYMSLITKILIAHQKYTINYILWLLILWLIISLYNFWSSPLKITQIFTLFWFLWVCISIIQVVWTKKV